MNDPTVLETVAGLALVVALVVAFWALAPFVARAADHLPASIRNVAAALGFSDAHPD